MAAGTTDWSFDNVAWIYDYDETWWIAGLGGALIGTVWNFVVSAALVWRQR
jgi:dolichol-phosphate mannosyltransferase